MKNRSKSLLLRQDMSSATCVRHAGEVVATVTLHGDDVTLEWVQMLLRNRWVDVRNEPDSEQPG